MILRKDNDWKKYYFILKDGTLVYSKSKGVKKILITSYILI